ncbi:oxidoreductase [Hoeflea poritis]|uniref:Oxidoreductase n=1 Tax=Hoeflea poritis TaxID=2993659 RepID=A0ABT4VTC1_9HYPH|nr:oxidoreductase [Hoeflea poritis]MDA4847931.1 oxidoreductase [Hoeflea poritis]
MAFDLSDIPNQTGRIAIVTGANAGLGKETAIGLALTGMKVVMACRNRERAEAARTDILKSAPGGDVEIMTVDLSSLASVRQFADAFVQTHGRLDLLINNAGVMIPPHAVSEDGFEIQMAANYFGHFVLTARLIDLMPDTPQSRVVSLASIAHKNAAIDFEGLRSGQGQRGGRAYGQSKLACLMFALELDRRLRKAGRQILSVAAHPGVSGTELVRHMNPVLYTLLRITLMPFFTHAPAQGAQPTLVAALDPDVEGGQYFGPQGVMEMRGPTGLARMRPQARDADAAKRLWELSEQLTGERFAVVIDGLEPQIQD